MSKEQIIKHLVVHQECIFGQKGRTDLSEKAFNAAITAMSTLLELYAKLLPTITIDESNRSSITAEDVINAEVLVDDLSAWELQQTDLLRYFTDGVSLVLVYGAFNDVCVVGACTLLERLQVPHRVVSEGTIRLFDEDGIKLYPPIEYNL